jgi:hypothetical protein
MVSFLERLAENAKLSKSLEFAPLEVRDRNPDLAACQMAEVSERESLTKRGDPILRICRLSTVQAT